MPTSSPTRRAPLKLPSRRNHLVLAGTVLLLGFAIPVLAARLLGDPMDAVAGGTVAVVQLPPAEPVSALDNETLDTPDLLAGEVPDGANPTETLSPEPATPAADTPSPALPKVVSAALPPAPIAGLTRQGRFGPVPKSGARSALTEYKRPFRAKSNREPVSLIIGGLGLNRILTQRAIDELPPDVTLSFAAHATGLQRWVDAARRAGHEVLIEIPLESTNFNPLEPGADRALRLEATAQENARNLDWLLSRSQGYFGVTNFNGDAFLTRTDVAAPFMDALAATGLGFITDGDFETPTLGALAISVNQPFKAGHGLIDPSPVEPVIQARLTELAGAAKSGGHPVGVGYAYAETLQEAQAWIASLDGQGLQLTPASAALK